MSQLAESDSCTSNWRDSTLLRALGEDISAAAISATLISPVLTAIDRAVVENAASNNRPLFSTFKTHVLCSLRYPQLFFRAKPFFIIWTLYAATYSTANATESITKTLSQNADKVLVSSVTFFSTCLVNVPLGVWKDVRFVQYYGCSTAPDTTANTLATKKLASTTAECPIRPAKFPRIVGATFLFRDALTILGSFTLPSMLPMPVSDSLFSDPMVGTAAKQLLVPVLSQVIASPVHLLGLDLYSHPQNQDSVGRMSRIRRNIGPTTAMRCCRIIPAFGLGCIMNTGLRNYFHSMAGSI